MWDKANQSPLSFPFPFLFPSFLPLPHDQSPFSSFCSFFLFLSLFSLLLLVPAHFPFIFPPHHTHTHTQTRVERFKDGDRERESPSCNGSRCRKRGTKMVKSLTLSLYFWITHCLNSMKIVSHC